LDIERRAWFTWLASVLIPTLGALIGAGATIAVPFISPGSPTTMPPRSSTATRSSTTISPTGGISIQGARVNFWLAECVIYEEGVIVRLARKDPGLAKRLIKAKSPINRICGLSPSRNLLPQPLPSSPAPSVTSTPVPSFVPTFTSTPVPSFTPTPVPFVTSSPVP
jgi:hypothetical protein